MEALSSGKIDVLDLVTRRASEVTSLCQALREGQGEGEERLGYGYDALSRAGQRRTTSHKRKGHRRRPNQQRLKLQRTFIGSGKGSSSSSDNQKPKSIPLCRQARRRQKFQRVRKGIQTEAGKGQGAVAVEVETTTSVQYLETHKWYAKRQKMVRLWNHWLPQGWRGKGLGISSFCNKLSQGFVSHDMSYLWSIRLVGPLDSILCILELVCGQAAIPRKRDLQARGVAFEQEATIHRKGKYPRQLLSPVLITWTKCADVDTFSPLLWVNCESYLEVKKEIEETLSSVSSERVGVKVVSLESKIKRIEVRGVKCREALKSALTIHDDAGAGRGEGAEKADDYLEDGVLSLQQHQHQRFEGRPLCKVWHRNVLDPRFHAILKNCRDWYPPEHFRNKVDKLKSVCDRSKVMDLDQFDRSPLEDDDVCKLQRKSDLLHDIFEVLLSEHGDHLMSPTMVVAKPNRRKSLSGYSLLLPAAWVQSIWMPLIRLGANGIGLREWKWYLQSCGRCAFPDSYPDIDGGLNVRNSLECATNASLPTNEENQFKGANWWKGFCGDTHDDHKGEDKNERGGIFVARTKEVLESSIHCVNYAGASRKANGSKAVIKWVPVKEVAPTQDPLCLVRALLLPVRRGTVESWSKIFKATQKDMDTFLASRNRAISEDPQYDLGESRPLLGHVTLGVLPKKCKGFNTHAEVFCQAKTFWKAMSEQQNMRGSFKDRVLVMLLCKDRSGNSGILRPAFATLADKL